MAASNNSIVNDRRRSREAPRPHFKRLAATWSGMVGVEITPAQACMMLAAMKMVREWYMHDPDNIADAEGYLSMVEEVRIGPEPPPAEEPPIPRELQNLAREQADRA